MKYSPRCATFAVCWRVADNPSRRNVPNGHAAFEHGALMPDTEDPGFPAQRPWDARLARWLVAPLCDSRVVPNHLTTVRLLVGLAAAAAFIPGSYGWANWAAVLMVPSDFLVRSCGELARVIVNG